ncbi:DUF3365 domain-containing protein [Idiomarina sp.]|uniref:Tll0287-like domain-containing protein n=1 Tax=Idiomarina sp. TaxID=1874361 RepID=UPI001D36F4F9|nr:DUF3365 domain-containing protein [Idiomarina sp.]MCJ8316317.1 DUF3365 domain-containing protein [Idiomarina sp.]NQZ16228.1 DUF3365 domain-containing protein [Idiomarina sp.]
MFTVSRLISAIVFLSISTSAFASEENYEEAAKQLQQRLGKVLMSTIQKDGHVAAISVCNEQAPQIASAVSDELNLSVGRTSLKLRNPQNEPTKKQEQVLKEFERLWEKSKENVPTQHYTNESGETVWMKAIVMQPQCAACHGSNIDPELEQAITEKYPNDKATGFDVGNIRGAFVVRSKNHN